ncbi:MAG TPA: GGDEF domain-containing protein [Thermoanaerobaculia bacterium]|nr:GGDEF domain-containing protein [Thermoanaerobaculia bacterium]
MRQIDAAAERILGPFSALLKKPLRIVESVTDDADEYSMPLPAGNLRLVSTSGGLNEHERAVLGEVFTLIRDAADSIHRMSDLERRMVFLERDNLDLMVKNRVLSEVSARDALTGLYNRWFVMEKIESEINRSLRSGSALTLMLLDIDNFKRINDTYGQTAGDHVLQSFGRLLKESCRVYDVPGRYGGEEFCVILPDTRVGSTPKVAERIRGRLEGTAMDVGDSSLIVTASIGIAGLEAGEGDTVLSPSALIDRADRALDAAKRRGRNRVEMWDATLVDSRPAGTDH